MKGETRRQEILCKDAIDDKVLANCLKRSEQPQQQQQHKQQPQHKQQQHKQQQHKQQQHNSAKNAVQRAPFFGQINRKRGGQASGRHAYGQGDGQNIYIQVHAPCVSIARAQCASECTYTGHARTHTEVVGTAEVSACTYTGTGVSIYLQSSKVGGDPGRFGLLGPESSG